MTSSSQPGADRPGLLGDTPHHDYGRRLRQFNAFAAPELRALIAGLGLRPGMRVLDAGCGAGMATGWLAERVAPGGLAVGMDLSAAHVRLAAAPAGAPLGLIQADLGSPPLRPGSLDLVWCVNTINHLGDRPAAVRALAALLRPGGRLALGQSHFLPEQVFAWDMRLERAAAEAGRAYNRDAYGLSDADSAGMRSFVGLLRAAGLCDVRATTVAIERVAPLGPDDEAYLAAALARGYWNERLRPYLAAEDWDALAALCDPASPAFCLRWPDFHFIQTFTLVTGGV